MKEVRQKKQLQSQLNILRGDAETMKLEIAQKQKEYALKLKAIAEIKEKLIELEKDKTVKISEHAIVRYFERVKGFDISQVEKEILTDEVLRLIETLGTNGTYPNKDFKIILKDGTVTTVI